MQQKRKLQANIFNEHRCKNSKQNIGKPNLTTYQKDHAPPAHPYLLQHYLQQLSYGNSQNVPLLMNGSRKCGNCTQWNSIQPQKRMKFCHLQVNEWNWRTPF
jgi:hypothetical protein